MAALNYFADRGWSASSSAKGSFRSFGSGRYKLLFVSPLRSNLLAVFSFSSMTSVQIVNSLDSDKSLAFESRMALEFMSD